MCHLGLSFCLPFLTFSIILPMFNHTFYLNFFRINLLCQSYLLFKLFVSLTILPVILFFYLYFLFNNSTLSLTYIFHLNFHFLITQQVYHSYLLNNLLVFYFLSLSFSSSNTSNLLFYSFIFFVQPTDTNLLLCISISTILSILFIDHFYCLIVIHTPHLSLHFSYSCSSQCHPHLSFNL